MTERAIREADGKRMIAHMLKEYTNGKYAIEDKFVKVGPHTDLKSLPETYKWLLSERLATKPDQLIKRRGKSKLILLNAEWKDSKRWIEERMGRPLKVGNVTGILDHFVVEPFIQHSQDDEYYFAILSQREGERMMFHDQGGVDIGDIDAEALEMFVPIGNEPKMPQIERELLNNVPEEKRAFIAGFMKGIFRLYSDLHFTYLEMNPIVFCDDRVYPLDLAARLDDAAAYLCNDKWGHVEFPTPFGRSFTKEEAYVRELDYKTGASLKLVVLNPRGRIWTMIAGGGASVIYADTITDLGFMNEMANYGEYSGDPDEDLTCSYAKTILDLMTREKDPRGKCLLIGGGISNFTDVATTFKGIVRALRQYAEKLRQNDVRVYVRRGGPNYKEGLRIMKELGPEIGVPVEVYGPETPMTRIVTIALRGDS